MEEERDNGSSNNKLNCNYIPINMEMNTQARGLNALQRSYNACLTDAMRKFMELPKEARV